MAYVCTARKWLVAAVVLAACTSSPDNPGNSSNVLPDGGIPIEDVAPRDRGLVDVPSRDDGVLVDLAPDGEVVDSAPPPDAPMLLSVVLRQQVQACSSCGIWFHWQQVQSQKPRLEVVYEANGNQQVRQYQHGLDGEDNAHSITLRPDASEADRDDRRHTMLIKKSPARTGLLRVDMSDIPSSAAIVSAKLHLHLHDQEGLANSDHDSVIVISECPGDWSWDTVTWSERSPGVPWKTPGGDVARLVLQVHADTDMHQRGFIKAAPNGFFNITAHVQLLQSER